jgi:polyhydroxyalkanoate synthesis regulator phasin
MQYRKLVDSGGSRSLSVEKLLNRVTDPSKGPLTYEEARDFGSNLSRLSADESQRLTPVMKRAVGQISQNLRDTTAQTATAAGKGPQFQAAMKEYSKASNLRETVDDIKGEAWNTLKKTVPWAAGAYTAKKIYDSTK